MRTAERWGRFVAVALVGAAPAIGSAQEVAAAAPPAQQAVQRLAGSQAAEQADISAARPDDPPAREARPQARRAPPRAAPAGRPRTGGTLDERVAFYAKELNLDARQQSELRGLLSEQREQVQRLWSDTTMPAAQRIQATKAIEDATSDRIRALLNEEQRKKYNPPRPPHDKLIQAQATSVEDWMRLTGSRQGD